MPVNQIVLDCLAWTKNNQLYELLCRSKNIHCEEANVWTEIQVSPVATLCRLVNSYGCMYCYEPVNVWMITTIVYCMWKQ
jgi:hypothetical protein